MTPSLFHASDWRQFSSDIRNSPIHFPYSRNKTERILVEPPKGYEFSELPEPVVVKDPPLSLAVSFFREGTGFRFVRHVRIDTATWPAEDYDRLKSFFDTLQEADRQVVVFTKSDG